MRTLTRFCGLAILAAGLAPHASLAQFVPQNPVGQIGTVNPGFQNPRPTFSPYLNLTRPGNVSTNYYGLVRPQLDANRNFQNLMGTNAAFGNVRQGGDGQDFIDPNAQMYVDPAAGLQTGHSSTWFYTSTYFPPPGARMPVIPYTPGGQAFGGGNNAAFNRNGNNNIAQPFSNASRGGSNRPLASQNQFNGQGNVGNGATR